MLCVADVMADFTADVQLNIQSVPVYQPLGTKHVKLPLYVILKTVTLCYT